MTAKEYVEKLCDFGHRRSTTENERKAAGFIMDRMKTAGFKGVHMDEFRFSTTFSWVHFYHYFGISVAGVLSMFGRIPAYIGVVMALITLVSIWGEGNSKYHMLRTFAPKGRSQNVLGKVGNPSSPIKIFVMGHIDTTRSGLLFHPKVLNAFGSEKDPVAVLLIPFIVMCLLFVSIVVRALGVGHWTLTVVQGLLLVLPILGSLLMIERELFGVNIPGASDNAAGMGIAMEIGERLVKDPPKNAEVWVVGSGCEEPHLGGALDLWKNYSKELDPDKTFFINFDGVACDPRLCYGHREGYIQFFPYSPKLLALAEEITREKHPDVEQVSMAAASDLLVMLARGYQGICFISFNERHVPSNYHWPTDCPANMHWPTLEKAVDFGMEMVRRLDAQYDAVKKA